MKTKSIFDFYQIPTKSIQNLAFLLLFLISQIGLSQTAVNETNRILSKKTQLTSLHNVVVEIKENNESIKNVAHVNVMVNDMLIEDLNDFIIDPKSIAVLEVLVLEPREGKERINSIIINTKEFR